MVAVHSIQMTGPVGPHNYQSYYQASGPTAILLCYYPGLSYTVYTVYTVLSAILWRGLHSSTVRLQLMKNVLLSENFGPIYTFLDVHAYSLAGSPIESYSSL